MQKRILFQQFESPLFAAEDVTFCKFISDSLMVEYLAVSQVVVVRFHVAEDLSCLFWEFEIHGFKPTHLTSLWIFWASFFAPTHGKETPECASWSLFTKRMLS
jgi:hypothetical protein